MIATVLFLFWGFFAHRLINQLAVYGLPPVLMPFYLEAEAYLSDHAVDPDRRRHASPFEASRHYIDFEHYGEAPYDSLPRSFQEAAYRHHTLFFLQGRDTFHVKKDGSCVALVPGYREIFQRHIAPHLPDGEWTMPTDSLLALLPPGEWKGQFHFRDGLIGQGILPWHLLRMQRRLTEAFIQHDRPRILQLSAELGHYLADAHVPLHTTRNYNGQLSGQQGIHALWESHLPEYFAASSYRLWRGQAKYRENPGEDYWEICLESRALVAKVLQAERQVRRAIPSHLQWCFRDQGRGSVRKPCPGFCLAFQDALDDMVEKQMKKAIQAIANSWYSAWMDAGQPPLAKMTGKLKREKQKPDPPGFDGDMDIR